MINVSGEDQKKIFAENLLYYLKVNKIMQKDLAKKAGLSANAITEYLHCRTYPSPSAMQRLADALGVYMSDLREPRVGAGHKKAAVAIPVLGSIPAGIPIEAVQDILDWEEISEDMARAGEYFALRIRGTSMQPRFNPGDVIIVRQQEEVENGEIAVVMINGEDATVKRFFKSASGITLAGTNPDFVPLTFSAEEAERLPVRILGKVVELRAKF